MGLILCKNMIGSPLGLNSDFIPGVLNDTADKISRSLPFLPNQNHSQLFQAFPHLRTFRQLTPPPELLSQIFAALLLDRHPGLF